MRMYNRCARSAATLVAAAVVVALSICASARAQDEADPQQAYIQAYVDHVDLLLATLQGEVRSQKSMFDSRGGELLEEIAERLITRQENIGAEIQFTDAAVPPAVQKLNRQERSLTEEVLRTEDRILAYMDEISGLRDSLASGLKPPQDVRRLVDERATTVRAELTGWRTLIDGIRQELVRDGTPDEARRLFVREYNSISLLYNMGQHGVALQRLLILREPYGDYPLNAWLESVPFYMAECYYSIGEWRQAYDYYNRVWSDAGNLYAPEAYLDWAEMAYMSGRFDELARAWAARPPLPTDPLQSNRLRILVAGAYLHERAPNEALRVLRDLVTERPLQPGEEDYLMPEDLFEIQRANDLLLTYGKMLRAEAHLSLMDESDQAAQSGPSYSMSTAGGAGLEGMDAELMAGLDSALAAFSGSPGQPMGGGGAFRDMSDLAFMVAQGQVVVNREADDENLVSAVSELQSALQRLEAVDVLSVGADTNATLRSTLRMSLGYLYFTWNKYREALDMYGRVPLSSPLYPEAKLASAWCYMELGQLEDAKVFINHARRWPLPPAASLEAMALDSYVLSRQGRTEEAERAVNLLMRIVDLERRRSISHYLGQRLQGMDDELEHARIAALEGRNEQLYRQVVSEKARLDSVRQEMQRINRYLAQYASATNIDTAAVATARASIAREEDLIAEFSGRLRRMGRSATEPASGASPELAPLKRQRSLRAWLQEVNPTALSPSQNIYETWAEYAAFAYARRFFDENELRRNDAERLKEVRTRMRRLLDGGTGQ